MVRLIQAGCVCEFLLDSELSFPPLASGKLLSLCNIHSTMLLLGAPVNSTWTHGSVLVRGEVLVQVPAPSTTATEPEFSHL